MPESLQRFALGPKPTAKAGARAAAVAGKAVSISVRGNQITARGGTFAVVQFAWSHAVGPELVDIVGGLTSIAALSIFLRVWRPREVWGQPVEAAGTPAPATAPSTISPRPPPRAPTSISRSTRR
jgi:L-lactate permease